MTTLADRIADFETQANQLLDLPQQIADTAQARINEIGAYYQQRLQTMEVYAYVHPLAGSDDAAGSESAPLKTIEEALRRTPPGGRCVCRLLTNYHFSASLDVSGNKYLALQAAGSLRHRLTFERFTHSFGDTTVRRMAGVMLGVRAGMEFMGLTVELPPLDGTWGSLSADAYNGVVQAPASSSMGWQTIKFYYCDIDIPAQPFAPLVGLKGSPHSIVAYALTATNQPLDGHWYADVTAGTDPTTLPWLATNLTSL